MASSRKYWTDAELLQDAEYWEGQVTYCLTRSLSTRFEEQHDYWRGKQCAAREKAKASRAELERRNNVNG